MHHYLGLVIRQDSDVVLHRKFPALRGLLSNRRLRIFFFFNDTATTEIYTLSLHDALPISYLPAATAGHKRGSFLPAASRSHRGDRKSTRLNSSHGYISYAVFCLKKKK